MATNRNQRFRWRSFAAPLLATVLAPLLSALPASGAPTWPDATLAPPTTYTFIARHEPAAAASTALGVSSSETIMATHPYTLAIVRHTHTYAKTGARQVTIGNGGAPLTGGATYGYGLVTQQADRAVQIDRINHQTGAPDSNFRFAVNLHGSVAAP